MPRGRQPKLLKHPQYQIQSDEEMIGQAVQKDYISLKSKGPYKLKPDEQSTSASIFYEFDYLKKFLQNINPQKSFGQVMKPKNKGSLILNAIHEQLSIDKNVCVFGGYSKVQILDSLTKQLANQYEEKVFVIRGFMKNINEKKIFNQFGTFLINAGLIQRVYSVSTRDQLQQYKNFFQSQKDLRIYVVFHSLDNSNILTSQCQKSIAKLLTLPGLRLIASVDSIKVAITWSLITTQIFKFSFISAFGTKIPYKTMLNYQPMAKQKSEKSQMQVKQIWKSLNSNQKKVAAILAKNQLRNMETKQQNYYTVQELLDICIDQIILSEQPQLHENLLQLLDHNVIVAQTDVKKNRKVYIMRLDQRILQNIVDGKYDHND